MTATDPLQTVINDALLAPQPFDDVMQGSVSALAKLDVKLSVVQFVLLSVTLPTQCAASARPPVSIARASNHRPIRTNR